MVEYDLNENTMVLFFGSRAAKCRSYQADGEKQNKSQCAKTHKESCDWIVTFPTLVTVVLEISGLAR